MSLDDFTDLNPATIAVNTDQLTHIWQPTIAGPISAKDLGQAAFYQWGKEWLTVSPITNRGQFTDIQKAINKVAIAGGGNILLDNGSYSCAPIYLPSCTPLEIMGKNRKAVIIKNQAGNNLFKAANLQTRFNIHNLTYISQNIAAGTVCFFNCTGSDCTGFDIHIHDIDLSLWNDAADGDIFAYLWTATDIPQDDRKIVLSNLSGTAGKNLILTNDQGLCRINDNILNNFWRGPINLSGGGDVYVTNNRFINSAGMGQIGGSLRTHITGNIYRGNFTDAGIGAILQITQSKAIVAHNSITATNSTRAFYGIRLNGGITKTQIVHNDINLTNGVTYDTYGIDAQSSYNIIESNGILINSIAGATAQIGIALHGEFAHGNILSQNIIDMGTTAANIGISLDVNTNHNQGSDNIIYNSTLPISNSGASNTVSNKVVT